MNQYILIGFYLILAGAALQDIAMLRISNLFSIALILLFGAWLWANGLPATLWQNAVLFAIVLLLGLLLFAAKWFGGGDVKFLSAGALWFDLQGGLALFVYMTLCGGLLSLLLVFARRMLPAGVRGRLGWPGLQPRGPIPYGVAISFGLLLALSLNGANPDGRLRLPDLHMGGFPSAPSGK